MGTVLQVQNLNVTYQNRERKVRAVRDASLTIQEGESLGIVGESGSGKSTLAMAILKLLPPVTARVTGQCVFLGQDLLSVDEEALRALRWKELAVVFQKAMNALSPVHRIQTQIEDIYRIHEPKATRAEICDRAMELFQMVGLPQRVYRLYPHEMSGGMLQRVSIAISLLHNPKLLIFDEATTALDVVTQGQILQEVVQLEQTLHTTRIMITHDMSVVSASCTRAAVMYAGEILESGATRDVLKTPMHPYTQGLLQSFPTLTGERRELKSIPGSLPDLAAEDLGCVFAPRCPYATERCRNQRPPQVVCLSGQIVRCWRYGGEDYD